MQSRQKLRWATLILFGAGAFFLLAYLLPSITSSFSGSSDCIKAQDQQIAQGRGPSNKPWSITASIRNNGSCDDWLVSVSFRPAGTNRGSWRGAWGIPAHGHLSNTFTIAAQDDLAGSERAISGVVGGRVTKVVVETDAGHKISISPKLPSAAQRNRFVWLRGMRYLMRFYPLGEHVVAATLFDSRGDKLYSARAVEGSVEGSL